MFGIPIFELIKAAISALIGFGIGATIFWNVGWYDGKQTGRDEVFVEIAEQDRKAYEQRNETNVEVNTFDSATLCRELGGRWVQSNSKCE